jgi:DNA-directed RNA polymerase subunit alpha
MTAVSAKQKLDELLEGAIDRTDFDKLVEVIYESYNMVDATSDRAKEMVVSLEAGGEDDPETAEKAGILLVAMGEYQEAAETLRPVSDRPTAAHFLGRALLKLRREQEAIEYLEAGRKGDNDTDTDVLLVDAHCALRHFDEAEELAEKLGGDSVDEKYARARVADLFGDYAEAMELYEEVLEQKPTHSRTLFQLAVCCDLNGENERAVELYKRCAQQKPTYVGALINLGILHEDDENYYEAIDCYKRVLAIAPRHRQAQMYLKDAEASLTMYVDMRKSKRMQRMEEIFALPISGFELSPRSRAALDRLNVKTLGGLTRVTREQLLSEKNFGDTSLEEVESLLARYNLDLADEEQPILPEAAVPEAAPAENEALGTPVDDLNLSTRCRKCMDRLGVKTVGELTQKSESDLLAVPNFGSTSLNEIVTKLTSMGLSLQPE